MTPGDLLVALERLLELAPALLAPRLVARQHRFAERVLDALQIDLDGVADLDFGLPARARRIRATRRGLRSSAPTSMTATSFSMPTTVPLMTEPSCRLPWVNDFSSISAKSSRDGVAEAGGSGGHELSWLAGGVGLDEWRCERSEAPRTRQRQQTRPPARCRISSAARRDHRAIETMVQVRRAVKKRGRSRLILHDGSAVSRAPGPLGRPRQCRWRPGMRRLYPNAWYRASAHPARASAARWPGACRARRGAGYRPGPSASVHRRPGSLQLHGPAPGAYLGRWRSRRFSPSASGKITVPMSRPSSTAPGGCGRNCAERSTAPRAPPEWRRPIEAASPIGVGF